MSHPAHKFAEFRQKAEPFGVPPSGGPSAYNQIDRRKAELQTFSDESAMSRCDARKQGKKRRGAGIAISRSLIPPLVGGNVLETFGWTQRENEFPRHVSVWQVPAHRLPAVKRIARASFQRSLAYEARTDPPQIGAGQRRIVRCYPSHSVSSVSHSSPT